MPSSLPVARKSPCGEIASAQIGVLCAVSSQETRAAPMSHNFTVPLSAPTAKCLPSLEIAMDQSGPPVPLNVCRGVGISFSPRQREEKKKNAPLPNSNVNRPAAVPRMSGFQAFGCFFLGQASVSDD